MSCLLSCLGSGNAAQSQTLASLKGTVWDFHEAFKDPGDWSAKGYSKTADWKSGAAPLGFSNSWPGGGTALTKGSALVYFFRLEFAAPSAPQCWRNLTLSLVRDDGAVVYLNGKEIARSNMPAATQGGASTSCCHLKARTVKCCAPALNAADNGNKVHKFVGIDPSAHLVAGAGNVLAVSVHQLKPESSDLKFALGAELGRGVCGERACEESLPRYELQHSRGECNGKTGKTCAFACDAGYTRTGARTCTPQGLWSGGSCAPKRCVSRPLPNAETSCAGSTGDVCTRWTCVRGYVNEGKLTCGADGKFGGSGKCKLVDDSGGFVSLGDEEQDTSLLLGISSAFRPTTIAALVLLCIVVLAGYGYARHRKLHRRERVQRMERQEIARLKKKKGRGKSSKQQGERYEASKRGRKKHAGDSSDSDSEQDSEEEEEEASRVSAALHSVFDEALRRGLATDAQLAKMAANVERRKYTNEYYIERWAERFTKALHSPGA